VAKGIEIMKTRNQSICDIAFEVGFGNLRSFERAFKKYTNMTVRELENFVKRLILIGDTHSAFEGLKKKRENGQKLDGKPSLLEATRRVEEEVERAIIGQVLQRNGWNRKRTADTLQISYRSLLSKIKKLEIA